MRLLAGCSNPEDQALLPAEAQGTGQALTAGPQDSPPRTVSRRVMASAPPAREASSVGSATGAASCCRRESSPAEAASRLLWRSGQVPFSCSRWEMRTSLNRSRRWCCSAPVMQRRSRGQTQELITSIHDRSDRIPKARQTIALKTMSWSKQQIIYITQISEVDLNIRFSLSRADQLYTYSTPH